MMGAKLQEKIMIVDDEAAIADLVEVYLSNEGYKVYKFYSALDALACADREELSLAILDVMMPKMDGFALCRHIREKHFYPIIMLTAKIEDIGVSPWSEICQIFRDRAADYGFIERYPKGKENITHIGHEPWHFRYVGVEHAKQMTERNPTLEEYVEWLKNTTGKEEGYGTTYPYTPRRLRG